MNRRFVGVVALSLLATMSVAAPIVWWSVGGPQRLVDRLRPSLPNPIRVDINRELPDQGIQILGSADYKVDWRVLTPNQPVIDRITFTNTGGKIEGFGKHNHVTIIGEYPAAEVESLELSEGWQIDREWLCPVLLACYGWSLTYTPSGGMPAGAQTSVIMKLRTKPPFLKYPDGDLVHTSVHVGAGDTTAIYSVTSMVAR